MVIEVLTSPSGMPSSSTFMSRTGRDGDAHLPTSPRARACRRRSPSAWADRRRSRGPSGPARAVRGSAGWVCSRSPKPANWRIVQKRPRYIVGCTPRVNGYSPNILDVRRVERGSRGRAPPRRPAPPQRAAPPRPPRLLPGTLTTAYPGRPTLYTSRRAPRDHVLRSALAKPRRRLSSLHMAWISPAFAAASRALSRRDAGVTCPGPSSASPRRFDQSGAIRFTAAPRAADRRSRPGFCG